MFIVLEGPDGVGKTFLANRLADKISETYKKGVVVAHEPTGSLLGELAVKEAKSGNPLLAASLFISDRIQHSLNQILPALREDKVVICDRWNASTVVYQGHLTGEIVENIRNACQMVKGVVYPDLFVLVGASRQLAEARINERGEKFDERQWDLIRESYDFEYANYRMADKKCRASGDGNIACNALAGYITSVISGNAVNMVKDDSGYITGFEAIEIPRWRPIFNEMPAAPEVIAVDNDPQIIPNSMTNDEMRELVRNNRAAAVRRGRFLVDGQAEYSWSIIRNRWEVNVNNQNP